MIIGRLVKLELNELGRMVELELDEHRTTGRTGA